MNKRNYMAKIICATSMAIFSLFSCFMGTYAWFLSNVPFETTVGSFSVVAPSGIEYELYYLDHFDDNSTDRIGDWNAGISEYSGYRASYTGVNQSAVFQRVDYLENGSVDTTATNGKDPTCINELWPAHKLTYALVFPSEAPTSFFLRSWGEEGDPSIKALSWQKSILSIVKTDEETVESTKTKRTYSITFSDKSSASFYQIDSEDPIGVENSQGYTPIVTIADSKWVVDDVETGIAISGGRASVSVLGIRRIQEGTPSIYEIAFSDSSRTRFSYNSEGPSITVFPNYEPTVSIERGKWVIDGVNTGIGIDEDSGTADFASLSISKSDTTYTITFSDSSTATFTYDGEDINVTPAITPSVTISGKGTWVVDGVDTDIPTSMGALPNDEVSLSWAIDLYGGAYSVTDSGDTLDDLATAFSTYDASEKEDAFTYSQASPAPAEDKPELSVVSSVPANDSGKRTIIFFTIEFSNEVDTFYSYEPNSGLYIKDVTGDSRCYEGLRLSELSFKVA